MTELEEIGCNCNYKECKTLDFLPFLCSGCNLKFCINHRNPHDHECKDDSNLKVHKEDVKLPQKIKDNIKSLQLLRCHVKGCSKLGIYCNKSNLIVCSYHRSLTSSSVQDIPTRVSNFTNKYRIIKSINLPISNGKTSELIRRIKIKGNSIGDTSISQSNRLPIALIIKANIQSLIVRDTSLPFCIWIDKTKTVGWNLDYIVRYLGISRLSDGSSATHRCMFNLIQDGVNLAPIPLCYTCDTLIKPGDTLYLI